MSYDEDEGFDNGFKMYDDGDDDELLNDEIIEEYEEEDPDSRYT